MSTRAETLALCLCALAEHDDGTHPALMMNSAAELRLLAAEVENLKSALDDVSTSKPDLASDGYAYIVVPQEDWARARKLLENPHG